MPHSHSGAFENHATSVLLPAQPQLAAGAHSPNIDEFPLDPLAMDTH